MLSEKVNPYRLRFIILAVVVCVLVTFVSAFFGSLASMLYAYGNPPLVKGGYNTDAYVAWARFVRGVGLQMSYLGGIIASILWCRWMFRRLRTGQMERFIIKAMWYGIKVGVLATLMIHVALMLASRRIAVMEPAIGLVCGIIAGVVLGAICGAICQAMAAPAAGEPTTTEQNREPQA